MNDADYLDALRLLDCAADLLKRQEIASRAELMHELRRLRMAFDALRVQIGQPAPEFQRN